MKTKLLSLLLMISSVLCYGQFEVRQLSDNALISEGQSVDFAEAGCGYNEDCNWKFKVLNTSGSDIYMRIFVDGLTNTDGSDFQLCFAGVCLNSVDLNSGYPSDAAMIGAGAANEYGNNFWNQNPSSTTTPMSWTFRFQAFDAVGGNEIGTPLTMTYNFNPNLSVDDFNISNVSIYPSITSSTVTINTQQDLSIRIYDILGKQVKEAIITRENNVVNVSDLAPQMYIVRLENNTGEKLIKKILVK